jgi:hypothetical protein
LDPTLFPASFVVHKVVLVQVLLRVLRLSSLSITPQILHTPFHFNVSVLRRTSGRSLGMLKQQNAVYHIRKTKHTKLLLQIFFFKIVLCILILSEFFIYQLIHKRISLRRILKFTLKSSYMFRFDHHHHHHHHQGAYYSSLLK